MRKKTINHLADTIFWYLLYFLPVITYLLYLVGAPTELLSIQGFYDHIGLNFVADNILVSSLTDLFGASGILPFFSTSTPIIIFSWFIGVYITHLAVDFLLFIPRLCHKWLKTFTNNED